MSTVGIAEKKRGEGKEINGRNPIISHCKIEYVTIVRESYEGGTVVKEDIQLPGFFNESP